jgi:hypothetical protein
MKIKKRFKLGEEVFFKYKGVIYSSIINNIKIDIPFPFDEKKCRVLYLLKLKYTEDVLHEYFYDFELFRTKEEAEYSFSEIVPKYSLGDVVFFEFRGEIYSSKIRDIKIKISRYNTKRTLIYYTFYEYSEPLKGAKILEDNLFTTKEELIEYIKDDCGLPF